MADPAIRFEHVGFSYGAAQILREFSLRIEAGERVCLTGPSGCGKTTVLRLVMGLEKPSEGTVFINGSSLRPVFQEDRLLPFLTVRQNVELFSGGKPADGLLDALGIGASAEKHPADLSGGMARRAAIARALAGDGELYVFDEPFNGLDAENAEKAVALILQYTQGKTLLCVLHDPKDAERLGCRVIRMEKL